MQEFPTGGGGRNSPKGRISGFHCNHRLAYSVCWNTDLLANITEVIPMILTGQTVLISNTCNDGKPAKCIRDTIYKAQLNNK